MLPEVALFVHLLPSIRDQDTDKLPLYYQEREFIRILIAYGWEKVDEERYLWQHLFEELEEIALATPVFQQIGKQYRTMLEDGEMPDEKALIQTMTGEAKDEVINLVTERFQASKNWARFEIIVPDKDAFLGELVRTNILRIKYRHLEKMCKEVLSGLSTAEDLDAVMEGQQLYLNLKNEKSQLAKLLGIVIP